jgi:hypothetical protein
MTGLTIAGLASTGRGEDADWVSLNMSTGKAR